MDHVVNRRMSKRQQMRWPLRAADEGRLLDGRLEALSALQVA